MAIKKVYLVDTENVGTTWKNLLPFKTGSDQILLFYTENSPYVSYSDLQLILQFPDCFEMIKCYPGKNGLDFQLVSYLGYLLKSASKSNYVIVSNDNGFDAAVKFWQERGMSVSRMNVHRVLQPGAAQAKKTAAAAKPESSKDKGSNPPVPAKKDAASKDENLSTDNAAAVKSDPAANPSRKGPANSVEEAPDSTRPAADFAELSGSSADNAAKGRPEGAPAAAPAQIRTGSAPADTAEIIPSDGSASDTAAMEADMPVPPAAEAEKTDAAPPVTETQKTDAAAPLAAETQKTDAAPPVTETQKTDAAPLAAETQKTDAAPPVTETQKTDAAPPVTETQKTDAAAPAAETKESNAPVPSAAKAEETADNAPPKRKRGRPPKSSTQKTTDAPADGADPAAEKPVAKRRRKSSAAPPAPVVLDSEDAELDFSDLTVSEKSALLRKYLPEEFSRNPESIEIISDIMFGHDTNNHHHLHLAFVKSFGDEKGTLLYKAFRPHLAEFRA